MYYDTLAVRIACLELAQISIAYDGVSISTHGSRLHSVESTVEDENQSGQNGMQGQHKGNKYFFQTLIYFKFELGEFSA